MMGCEQDVHLYGQQTLIPKAAADSRIEMDACGQKCLISSGLRLCIDVANKSLPLAVNGKS